MSRRPIESWIYPEQWSIKYPNLSRNISLVLILALILWFTWFLFF